INGDGEKSVYLYVSRYVAGQAVLNATGNELNVSDKGRADDKLRGLIATGECGVMFIDRALFDVLKEEGALEPLPSALGYLPDGAFDEYGIEIGDTDAYGYLEGLGAIPSDTVVCMRALASSIFSSESDAKEYYKEAKTLLSGYFSYTPSETSGAQ
ncbi:MAG: hypothetical protein IJT70_01110, partial [Clostridia bacterium]|nr:hypothetical protein [Clostridia bacterium]